MSFLLLIFARLLINIKNLLIITFIGVIFIYWLEELVLNLFKHLFYFLIIFLVIIFFGRFLSFHLFSSSF